MPLGGLGVVVVAGKRQSDGFRGDRTGSVQVGNNELCNDVISLFPSPRTIAMPYVPQVECTVSLPMYPDC